MMKLTALETAIYSTDVETVRTRQEAPERLPLRPRDSWLMQLQAKPGRGKMPRPNKARRPRQAAR